VRSTPRSTVTVASFAFSESVTIAEIYAQALEHAHIRVTRVLNLASREILEPALEQGRVDLVPEYLGTSLAFGAPGISVRGKSTAELYEQAQRAFAPRGITLLTPAPAQDQNGVVVKRDTADRLRLSKVSDLSAVAGQLVLGGPPECPERPYCLGGLRSTYGLQFRSFVPLDASGPVSVGALDTKVVDVAVLFTSDGHLSGTGLQLLADDRSLQPPENVVPMVRTDALHRVGPALSSALDQVSARLTTAALVGLNHRVQLDDVDPSRAAADWLRSEGLG
jgi:osmoprotectant transport system substrate-binding protein